jgi:hypothetical protein
MIFYGSGSTVHTIIIIILAALNNYQLLAAAELGGRAQLEVENTFFTVLNRYRLEPIRTTIRPWCGSLVIVNFSVCAAVLLSLDPSDLFPVVTQRQQLRR